MTQKVSLSLAEVTRRLDRAGITWAVFAGAAATIYGVTRAVTDVDILIPAADGGRAAALFPEAIVKRGEGGTVRGVQLPGFDLVAGLTTTDLDAAMAARIVRRPLLGITVPIIPAEDNILLKALWGRGPEEGKHDWEDVDEMMAHLPALDWEYLRRRAALCDDSRQAQETIKRLEALWRQLHGG
jgi:hypothetical protein